MLQYNYTQELVHNLMGTTRTKILELTTLLSGMYIHQLHSNMTCDAIQMRSFILGRSYLLSDALF